jgi:hypothetical protein
MPLTIISLKPVITVSGVRSSWPATAMKLLFI